MWKVPYFGFSGSSVFSSSSLFSIPANQEFVFIETAASRPGNRIINSVQNIVKQCVRSQPTTEGVFNLDRLNVEHDLQESSPHQFDKFLMSHVDVVLAKGVDDVGRHSKTACFVSMG